MVNIYSLAGEERAVAGTGAARAVRRNGMVPGVIYGAGKEQVLLSLPKKELKSHYYKQGFLSHMFDISVGKHKYRVLPKDVQLHPVTDEIEHIDFVHINENSKIKIHVTLHFINEAKCPGLKQGGVLNISRHDLEVYCLPNNIPEVIEVDIANLAVGQTIHVNDLVLPKGIETKIDKETTIAAIVTGKVNEEESAAAETEAASK